MKWETPERDTRGRKAGRWGKIADALAERPGEWALVAENDWVASARTGLVPRDCEVSCRGVNKLEPGKAVKIYARYIGE